MTLKKLNVTEIKILYYLSNVNNLKKVTRFIHARLGCEYSYLCRTLRALNMAGYIERLEKNKVRNAVAWDITKEGMDKLRNETGQVAKGNTGD